MDVAHAGHAPPYGSLGIALAQGEGVAADPAAARVVLGRGVPRDGARAKALYGKACDWGYAPACARAAARAQD